MIKYIKYIYIDYFNVKDYEFKKILFAGLIDLLKLEIGKNGGLKWKIMRRKI